MTYIVARANGATDWFNGLTLYEKLAGKSHGLHGHHIFPQRALYSEGGFDSTRSKDVAAVNQIANLAFLTAQSNLGLNSRLPETYLPTIPQDRLRAQQVPLSPALWTVDRYNDFILERCELLAQAINRFMDDLLASPPDERDFTIERYIESGESTALEFKGSLRWDYRERKVNKALEKSVVKTIAAFLNSGGGTLVVGLGDSGEPLGIEADMETLSTKSSLDGWELHLRNVLNQALSKEIAAMVDVSFADFQDRTLAIVHANPARRPVYVHDGQATEFYIRSGNTTQSLNVREALEYCQRRFPAVA
jgi:hypothetical protein